MKPMYVTDTVSALPSYVPIPGLGGLPVNAYVLQSTAPVLVDTGLHADSDEFMEALRGVVDPRELRWIWITHTDQDHVGSLRRLLDEAPRAKVVTSFLGVGKLALVAPIPPERLYLLNPGQSIDAGDRKKSAIAGIELKNNPALAVHAEPFGIRRAPQPKRCSADGGVLGERPLSRKKWREPVFNRLQVG